MTSPIRVRAATVPLAFAHAALAIGAGAFDPEAIEEREVREVRAHGPTPEALFAHWINECLYVHEVEGFAWRRIDFAVFDAEPRAGAEPMRLHSFLHGESLEPGGPPPQGVMPPLSAGAVSLRALGDEFELSITI
jgi:SHS2 domain-containing protein